MNHSLTASLQPRHLATNPARVVLPMLMTLLGIWVGPASAQTRTPEAPDFLPYLSPRCSAMNDAVRTASVRGLSYQAASELRRNYRDECAMEETVARQRLAQKKMEQRQSQVASQIQAAQREQLTEAAQEQCNESKRIIASKKRRTDLTPGERQDLQRFEENIRARCG